MVSRGFISTRYLREKQSLRIYSLGIRCFLFFFFFFYLIAFPKNRIHNYSLTPLGVWNFWIQKTFCHTTFQPFFFFYLIAFPKNRIHNYSLTPLGVWNFWIQKTFCHTTSDSNIFKRAHFERESKTSMVSIANRCVTPMREKVFYFFRTDFIRNFWHTTLSFPRITKENQ